MSNYGDNEKALNQFRKELMAMLGDVKQIDNKVLTQAVNEGVAYAKRRTPVGIHPNPVAFTVKNGPDAGKMVSFKTSKTVVGGLLKKLWGVIHSKKTAGGTEAGIENSAEYASLWNDGHRIVTKKGGPTKGFVKGTHVLEKTGNYIEGRMATLFEAEVERIDKKHDK